MKILGIVGWSGSGKTTLLTAMIGCLRARGLSVSTIKHAHHAIEMDQPGKDSYRHRHAGAEETILANAARFALFSEHRAAPEPDLAALLARLKPVDMVLVEGFKSYAFPKLEVHRPALGKPPLWAEMSIMAVASDDALPGCPVPVLDLNKPDDVTYFVLSRLGLDSAGTV
ncbi:MAG: molybdopterin-guanine dinucleotide biosynthesis protein B [Acidocella sp. 20-57-95]|nr:MAG: molybdopterin-guanine dinucleotide biosynthesis protein B [Acidocella sp. 20-57-95]OYV61418.1 MAG: molybdopterin-guanine dinucleotide biosynthesis protein B [Acidocella sp. 21-58-7]HQT62982.1 molybdopterin-guanine dinucleotide biosynthesis protein B [Acidocella sp.]HQU04369.1 molybdopterin-guanine dinucleotide biosynthesis protein B [Acidocella sp.]